jgi:hypothetical protein
MRRAAAGCGADGESRREADAAIRRAAGAQLRQERKARREPTCVSIGMARDTAVTVQMSAARRAAIHVRVHRHGT